jgi:hypothetical protein
VDVASSSNRVVFLTALDFVPHLSSRGAGWIFGGPSTVIRVSSIFGTAHISGSQLIVGDSYSKAVGQKHGFTPLAGRYFAIRPEILTVSTVIDFMMGIEQSPVYLSVLRSVNFKYVGSAGVLKSQASLSKHPEGSAIDKGFDSRNYHRFKDIYLSDGRLRSLLYLFGLRTIGFYDKQNFIHIDAGHPNLTLRIADGLSSGLSAVTFSG